MSAIIMDGKKVAAEIEAEIKWHVINEELKPRLLIVTDGHDPASKVYIRNKMKAAERCGISAAVLQCDGTDETTSFDHVISQYSRFDGVIVQLPMKDKNLAQELIDCIPHSKDVDGLKIGGGGCFEPCTPKGIIRLLDYYDIPIAGRHAVIVGRSNLVGKPLARMLLDRDATVTVCHSKTMGLPYYGVVADILISATGVPYLVDFGTYPKDQVIIDVGINRVDGKLCGDVNYESAKERVAYITPVPGGVGPMTVAMLMENTLYAARMRKEDEEC